MVWGLRGEIDSHRGLGKRERDRGGEANIPAFDHSLRSVEPSFSASFGKGVKEEVERGKGPST